MRIACVLGQGFEDSEFSVPYDRFRAAGHDVSIIGIKKGEALRGLHGKESATTELAVRDADAGEFDALFIPGGYSPDKLRINDEMIAFTRAFSNKPIFAICHGPQLLMTAKMVQGRTMTAWPTVQGDLRCCGAHVVDREVIVDHNIVTSRKPDDLDAFVRESLSLLGAGAEANV